MAEPRRELRIATRRSRLALWQAEHVKAAPGGACERLALTRRRWCRCRRAATKCSTPRSPRIGGKGLFVKELEAALAEDRADIAVHSMKDVPAELPPGYALAAILEREDPRDAFVSPRHENFAALPAGAVVGTSSLRRQAQIAARHPRLEIRPLRGNLDTRIAKLDRGEYAAIVLAAAGLRRLGLEARIRSTLSIEESLPAAGQAALGIECLAARTDVAALVGALRDAGAEACVRAEREVNRALGGSCTIPLGAFAELQGGKLRMRALVASPDGKRIARAEGEGDAARPEELGLRVAAMLRERGAVEILAALKP